MGEKVPDEKQQLLLLWNIELTEKVEKEISQSSESDEEETLDL